MALKLLAIFKVESKFGINILNVGVKIILAYISYMVRTYNQILVLQKFSGGGSIF